MKKMLEHRLGDKIEIETTGQMFGFRAGDIISSTRRDSIWYKKRVTVEGFEMDCRLWAIAEGDTTTKYTLSPNGLVLLARPGRLFKVGDRVYISVFNEEGRVIVMNPYDTSLPYLVQYGSEGIEHNGDPWFPKEYSDLATKKIIWCSAKILSPLI